MAIVVVTRIDGEPSPAQKSAPPAPIFQDLPQGVEVSAADLGAAYQRNALAAAQRFEAGPIRVTGKVIRIFESVGRPALQMAMTESGFPLSLTFQEDQAQRLARMATGQSATVWCRQLSEAATILAATGCRLETVQ